MSHYICLHTYIRYRDKLTLSFGRENQGVSNITMKNELVESGAANPQQSEYLQYAQNVEQALSLLESQLHNSDDPEEVIMHMLAAATEFYDGDWAGIMEADLVMKIWSPLWWYNRRTKAMTPNTFGDLQEGEYLVRWIDALMHGKPMIIPDTEEIQKSNALEYAFLKDNRVHSLIAVPFWKRPTGFLIVRNPKRYVTRSSLLQMMAFVAVSSVNEKRLMERTQLALTPAVIQSDSDVVVNFFDELQIITSKGVLTERDLNSPMIVHLVVYLLLHARRNNQPQEIFQMLWPDGDIERANVKVKSIVYRFQQMFNLISDYRLIEYVGGSYRINPELNVITDLDMFTDAWNQAATTSDLIAKGHLLKKAMDIYKNGLLPAHSCEHWLLPIAAHYSLRYIGVINQLLSTLNLAHDYVCIHEYAGIAVQAVPGSPDAHYWLVYAMLKLGTTELAKNELQAAKQMLTNEEYQDILQRLHEHLPDKIS